MWLAPAALPGPPAPASLPLERLDNKRAGQGIIWLPKQTLNPGASRRFHLPARDDATP